MPELMPRKEVSNVEKLVCDRCGLTYTDRESIESAKAHASEWAGLCRRDGDEPRGISPCPNIRCPGELLLKHTSTRPRPDTIKEVLDRYPCLVGHMICESLGYFTPESAANALLFYIRGEPFSCEWYTHMARGWDEKKLLEVGRQVVERAYRGRHHHYGYMAHYPQAKALVEHVRAGGQGPVFASWF